jgi:predicted N-acyltransferase
MFFSSDLKASIASSINEIDANAWNHLLDCGYPFLQHDFLLALELHDCLQPWGWQPVIFQLHDNKGELVAACCSYLKDNSYGEFVFDWAWADAYQRHDLAYYPKLVTSIPFTPAQGARLLAKNNDPALKRQLVQLIKSFCNEQKLSSAHFLFCLDADIAALKSESLLTRFDYQYHWRNQGYANFDAFLQSLNSKRRKNIKRERRIACEGGVRTEIIPGEQLNTAQWEKLYDFYRVTFLRKSGAPTFTLNFFKAVAHYLRAALAFEGDNIVAGAILYEGSNTLYGRHWGSLDHYDQLHFEVCYYAGIEYCIAHDLQIFEPGAQGEHKIWRGFLPVQTRSAHWIVHEGFRAAIADFLQREARAMAAHGEQLMESSPFRCDD